VNGWGGDDKAQDKALVHAKTPEQVTSRAGIVMNAPIIVSGGKSGNANRNRPSKHALDVRMTMSTCLSFMLKTWAFLVNKPTHRLHGTVRDTRRENDKAHQQEALV
jgi:hypothetical protein